MKPIQNYFSNPHNVYYGHGTGRTIVDIEREIFTKGLRCSHGQLYFTSCTFGYGSNELFDEQQELLNNWKHLESKKIVIVSLPDTYIVRRAVVDESQEEPFYYQASLEQESKIGSDGLVSSPECDEKFCCNFVRPEFIVGYYDVNNKNFISNPRYYENLPLETQSLLFAQIKINYIEKIKEICKYIVRSEISCCGGFDAEDCRVCQELIDYETELRHGNGLEYTCPLSKEEAQAIDKQLVGYTQKYIEEVKAERMKMLQEEQNKDSDEFSFDGW